MEGLVEIQKLHAGGLKDEDFHQAKREGRLKALLDSLPEVQRVHGKNRVFDSMAAYLLDKLFSCPNAQDPLYRVSGSAASLSFIIWQTIDDDTDDYEEWYNYYRYPHWMANVCQGDGNGWQRFVEEEIDPPATSDGLADDSLESGGLPHVQLRRAGSPSAFANRSGDFLGELDLPVCEYHLEAAPAELLCEGATDAGGSTGEDRDPASSRRIDAASRHWLLQKIDAESPQSPSTLASAAERRTRPSRMV